MTRRAKPSDWHFGFVAGASDGGSSEPPSWISDTAAYLAGLADGQAARAHVTSLRIDRDVLAELKVLAVQQRVRANDVILQAIENHLQLHGRRAA